MSKNQSVSTASTGTKKSLGAKIYKYRGFYVMFLPVLVFAIMFYYLPMLGVRYAFTNYNGIKDPSFVAFDNFKKMFGMPGFWSAFKNTLVISVVKLILTTLFAVVVSLFLNEIINIHFKKVVQTIIYLPHFLSWVVTASLFSLILAPTGQGLVNTFLVKLGVVDASNMIYFLGSSKTWRATYYIINLWKETGWQTVIFMATLAGMNTELYEAASIDGAGRWGKMRYITFPALANTILTVFILNLAKVMNLFESAFVLQNDAVLDVSNVLETYIYYQSFNSGSIPNYGYTTAVGLFKSLVGMVLVLVCNQWSKKVRDGRGIV
ncbi:MAG: ABC transporter permease subunit [Eubacterium sp.]|nr:ABC transporter permease subunit [Eubacterium sp.]